MDDDARARRPIMTRRRLEVTLGLLWLLDGTLQAQPYMFTSTFFSNNFGMANMGLPGLAARVEGSLDTAFGAHPAPWNAVFAIVQLSLGAGLLWPRTAKVALGASVGWGIAVWLIGEGIGGLFMGTSALLGAPGAALLYAVAAVWLWPARPDTAPGAAVADRGMLGGRIAIGMWSLLWLGTALLEVQSINHASGVPGAQLADIGEGEPGAVASINHLVGHLVAGRGELFALVVVVVHLGIAIGTPPRRTRRWALAVAIGVSAFYGLLGQDLGGVLTGRGTDPGSGPLLILLALALWPSLQLRPEPRAIPADRHVLLSARIPRRPLGAIPQAATGLPLPDGPICGRVREP
jgi:hypothetical protein